MGTSKSSSPNSAANAPTPDEESADVPSYEQARDELVDVVRRLEAGGTTLEESLTLWERGEELARICQSWLQGARDRLERAERPDQPDSSTDTTTDNDADGR